MVLNKAVQDKYNLEDCPGLVLPLVLERRKDTISTFTKKRGLNWEDDIETTKRRITSPHLNPGGYVEK
jgi:hypothetical protein